MYLTHLEVSDIKRFKRLKLDLTYGLPGVDGRPGRRAPRMWTVLIGENGTCKTTLLQCVALTALGSGDVRVLDGELIKLFPRLEDGVPAVRASAEALYNVRFEDARAAHERPERLADWRTNEPLCLRSAVNLYSLRHKATHTSDLSGHTSSGGAVKEARMLGMARRPGPEPQGFFVAAYGASRLMPDPGMVPNAINAEQRLKPLFSDSIRLNATLFANQPGDVGGIDSATYLRAMRRVLGQGDEALVPGLDGYDLDVRGDGLITRFHRHTFNHAGTPVPSISLPQGYQSVLTWLFDLVGQALAVPGAPTDPAELRGLVLIDELDQHLHPALQVRLVPHLRRVLPKMQFIVTTHSPGLLSSFSPEEIVPLRVDQRKGTVVVEDDSAWADPQMLTGSEILSAWFGRANGPLNPLGRDRRTLAGILATPEEMLNDFMRGQVEPLLRQLTVTLGPPSLWLSGKERERLAALRARRRG